MNATSFLGARIRNRTRRRFQTCRAIVRALEGAATSDRVLDQALSNYYHCLLSRCKKRGIEPPRPDGREAVEETEFSGVPDLSHLRPMISE